MKVILDKVENRLVVMQRDKVLGGDYGDPYNGSAVIHFRQMAHKGFPMMRVIFSNGEGWEHVSASWHNRTPTWGEMCIVKDLFFEPDECVVQFHPPRKEYVNIHPFCLHLWRPLVLTVPTPPTWMLA